LQKVRKSMASGNAERGVEYPHFFIISMMTATVCRSRQVNLSTKKWEKLMNVYDWNGSEPAGP
jgi:hypothetical protein